MRPLGGEQAAATQAEPAAPAQPATPGQARRVGRPGRQVAHDAPYVIAELRRIGLVTLACGGLLVALVAIDRLQ